MSCSMRDGLSSLAIALGLSLSPCPGSAEKVELHGVSGEGHPIYLTSMTHMEGGANDHESLSAFLTNVHLLEDAMDLADRWGAVLTVESERPFAMANVTWKRNFMQEILDRGHGTGTHCDVGYGDLTMSQADYERELAFNKTLVDRLVGATQNTGCSGAGGALDWVSGLANSGFEYVNGVVGMHYLPTLPWSRPEGYTDYAIRFEGLFHSQVPVDLLDRTYLRTLANDNDLAHDSSGGQLVFSAGGLGKLEGIAEGNFESHFDSSSVSEPALTEDDVDALVELIYWIDEYRDPSRFSKISIMSHANDWREGNHREMVYFLKAMKVLEDKGVIQWATEKQVVDAYLGR